MKQNTAGVFTSAPKAQKKEPNADKKRGFWHNHKIWSLNKIRKDSLKRLLCCLFTIVFKLI